MESALADSKATYLQEAQAIQKQVAALEASLKNAQAELEARSSDAQALGVQLVALEAEKGALVEANGALEGATAAQGKRLAALEVQMFALTKEKHRLETAQSAMEVTCARLEQNKAELTVRAAAVKTAATTSPEAQKELLLTARIGFQTGWNWRVDVPLGEFQGVSVDDAGLVVGIDFCGQDQRGEAAGLKFNLAVLAPLTSLQVVNLRLLETTSGNIEEFKGMQLKELNLQGCERLKGDIEVFKGMELTTLNLRSCNELTGDIEVFKDMPLINLDLYGCGKLTGDIRSLKECPLQQLNLSGSVHSTMTDFTGDIEVFKGMELTSLDLNRLDVLRQFTGDIEAFKGMPLISLDLYGCGKLTGNIDVFKGMPLTNMNLRECRNLTGNIEVVKGMQIKELNLSWCSELVGDIEVFKGMQIKELNLRSCKQLTGTTLALAFCRELETSPQLNGCPNIASAMPWGVQFRAIKELVASSLTDASITDATRSAFFQFLTCDALEGSIQQCVDSNPWLASTPDADGHTPANVASPANLKVLAKYLFFMGQFELKKGAPEHKSATSIVTRATNMLAEPVETADGGCLNTLDAKRAVVIKFMADEVQFRNEVKARADAQFDPNFVVSILATSDDFEGFVELSEKLGFYRYAIIMEAGERNIHSVFVHERPDEFSIRGIFIRVVCGILHIHAKGFAHLDLKGLNIMRSATGNHAIRLIDLDAAAAISKAFAGAKFSSGQLPPEMIVKLTYEQVQQLEAYWEEEKAANSELWNKVKPKRTHDGHFYGVKTFKMDADGQPVTEGLPYSLEIATADMDMWAVGVLLFLFITGENLFPVNRDDDLVSVDGMRAVSEWNDVYAEAKLSCIRDPAARDLVRQLLSRDPTKRLSAQEVLDHPFLRPPEVIHREIEELKAKVSAGTGGSGGSGGTEDMLQRLMAKLEVAESRQDHILALAKAVDEQTKAIDARTKEIDERTRVIVDLSIGTQKAIAKGVNELKNHITTAHDNMLPTIFVIVPKEQDPTDMEEILEEAKAAQQAFHEGKKLRTGKKLYSFGRKCADKAGKIYGTVTAVASDPVGTIKSTIRSKIMAALDMDEYEMFFVCELCYEKQSSDGEQGPWPYTISKQSEQTNRVAAKLIPLAKGALLAGKAVNGIAGIGKLMGFPVPTVPQDALSGAKEGIAFLSCTSNVEEFVSVEKALAQDEGVPSDKLTGYLQREYKRFVSENDPDNDWAGLSRVILDTGEGCWCCASCCKVLEEHPTESYEELRARVGAPLVPEYEESPVPTVDARRRSVSALLPPLLLPPNTALGLGSTAFGAAEEPGPAEAAGVNAKLEIMHAEMDEMRQMMKQLLEQTVGKK